MIFPRKLALRISAFVVRYSSADCKEWAEGMAREVTYIEGDWAALRWALGSTRILLDRRKAPKRQAPVPPLTLAEVPAEARTFVKNARSGWSVTLYIWYPLMIATDRLHVSPCLLTTGIAIAAFGAAAVCALWMVERRRLKKPAQDPIYDDAMQCARFYRDELERYRVTMWIPDFARYCTCAGVSVIFWHVLLETRWLLVMQAFGFVFMARMTKHQRWMNQRQIDQLDALLGERA